MSIIDLSPRENLALQGVDDPVLAYWASEAAVYLDRDVDRWYTIYMKQAELRRSNHSVYQINYHFVWIPKRRKKVLVGDVAWRLNEICQEVAQERGWTILKLAIQPDHVHLAVSATPREAPHEIVRAFKGRSSRILRDEFPHLLKLPSLWTHSYFVRTAGNVSAAVIEQYIKEQTS